jgi:hypothetical protein
MAVNWHIQIPTALCPINDVTTFQENRGLRPVQRPDRKYLCPVRNRASILQLFGSLTVHYGLR